ncbi:MAG: integration host factor subunit beta [Candidatus Hydrogenedentes bacterium]|nr:integration host factor subunit beta [Candidatus Hydrogenedentota bacterium]
MTKRELVIRVANNLGMTQSDIAKIIEGTFDAISEALAEGHRWELRDFGVFEVKTRASRIGRNPRTGDQVPVPERRVVTFRPGKKMKEMVATGDLTIAQAAEAAERAASEAGLPAPSPPAATGPVTGG